MPIRYLALFGLVLLLAESGAQVAPAPPLRLVDFLFNENSVEEERVFGWSIDCDGYEIIVGSSQGAHLFDASTRAYKFRLGGGEIFEIGFGTRVRLTPNFYIVSASSLRGGTIYLFNRRDGSLARQIPMPAGGTGEPQFARQLEVLGHRLFVSMGRQSPRPGLTAIGVVFEYDLRNLSQVRAYRSGDGERFDGFANAVSVDGDTLVVGANRKDSFIGAAYLFDLASGGERVKIQSPNPRANDWFGTAVLARGDRVYVSDRFAVYEYFAATGEHLGTYTPRRRPASSDGFGSSLELTDNGLLLSLADEELFVFDLRTREELSTHPNPLFIPIVSSSPGEVRSCDNMVISGASGGLDRATNKPAVLVYSLEAGQSVVQIDEVTCQESCGEMMVTVRVEPPASNAVTVRFETRSWVASEGFDFLPRSGTLEIPAGEASGTIAIPIIDDLDAEATEVFNLRILGGTGAEIAPASIPLRIDDDESSLVVRGPECVDLPSFLDDRLGRAVAGFANMAYVYSENLDDSSEDRGGVHVVNLSTGELVGTLRPDGFAEAAHLGTGLAADRTTLAVGADRSRENPEQPAIYLYDRETLRQTAVLAPGDRDHLSFGRRIALSDRYLVAAMPFESRLGASAGACYVYERESGRFLRRIDPSLPTVAGEFGSSISIHGDLMAVGSREGKRAYLYNLATGEVVHVIQGGEGDLLNAGLDFGSAVGLNDRFMLVGNPHDNTLDPNSGSILVFDVASGGLVNFIRAATAGRSSQIGEWISVDGDVAAVSRGSAIHLIEIPSGHDIARFDLQFPHFGFAIGREFVLTDTHVMVGAPHGRRDDNQGCLFGFPRDGNDYEIWRRGGVHGQKTVMAWEQSFGESEILFRYATGWREGDAPLSFDPWEAGRIQVHVRTRGDLRPDARYFLEASQDGTNWRPLVEVSPRAEAEGQPMTNQWEGELMHYSFRDSRLSTRTNTQLYRLVVTRP